MKSNPKASMAMTMIRPLAATAAALRLLAACGSGGGDGINPDVAGVVSTSTSVPRYGQDVVITLQGRNLDKPILFAAPGCSGFGRSAADPYVSTDTTAYYVCTTPGLGAQTARFVRPSDGVLLADVSFTVPLPQVTMKVDNGAGVSGDIVITLRADLAPITSFNFMSYVDAGFYTDTVFHRVVPGFIVQGGGYAKPLEAGGTLPTKKTTNAPIPLEDGVGLSNLTWTVAMARTSAINSADSEFFVNLADNTFLDRNGSQRGYAVFGTVTTGTDVVTAMVAAPCSAWPEFFGNDPGACLPVPNLVITSATRTR